MSRILFIRLSESEEAGAGVGVKAQKALKSASDKNKDEFLAINCLHLLKEDGTFDKNSEAFKAIADQIKKFNPDKMILATHGMYDNVTHCFAEKVFGENYGELANTEQLGDFFHALAVEPQVDQDKSIELTLCMCYAARTENYTADHSDDHSKLNYQNSFAYKFLNRVKSHPNTPNIHMIAATGAVSYNEAGKFCGETEESIILKKAIQKLAYDPQTNYYRKKQKIIDDYIAKSSLDENNPGDLDKLMNYLQTEHKAMMDDEEYQVWRFNKVIEVLNDYANIQESKENYGIVSFDYKKESNDINLIKEADANKSTMKCQLAIIKAEGTSITDEKALKKEYEDSKELMENQSQSGCACTIQ